DSDLVSAGFRAQTSPPEPQDPIVRTTRRPRTRTRSVARRDRNRGPSTAAPAQSVPAAISHVQTTCKNHSVASPFLTSPSASCLPLRVRFLAPLECSRRSGESSLSLMPSHILLPLRTESPQT